MFLLTELINGSYLLLSAMYKKLHNLLLSMSTPHIDEITGDHQREFRSYQIFYMCHILEKDWDDNQVVLQL
jgi:hypothetical protein